MAVSQVMEYVYEEEMEGSYRANLMKQFNKTLDEGYFTFVIIDAINDKLSHFANAYALAKAKGFMVRKFRL